MKVFSILSLITFILATEAIASTSDVKRGNKDDDIEAPNKNIWKGSNHHSVWGNSGHSNGHGNSHGHGNYWGHHDSDSESSNSDSEVSDNEQSSIYDGYMERVVTSDDCPAQYLTKTEGVTYPTIKKVSYYSSTMGRDREMNVILPAHYSHKKKYPVLYYLHALTGDEDSLLADGIGTDIIPTDLYNEGKAKEMIIVLPDQYVPADGVGVEPIPSLEYCEGYDNFINELINDIMPYIKSHYSIATGRENTAICGFSMGGRNSLYIGYTRSDLFGYVGAFSPAPGVTPGDDMLGHHKGLLTESEFRADVPLIVSFISCGTNDTFIYDFPKSYDEILTKNGQKNIFVDVPGADHDLRACATGYYNFIQTLFGALLH